ncbi:MAG: hypothetical protein IJS50_02930 [Desulfovibrio sp.]|nr:hypothetical protein [Desulfovibrio sp.]
MNVRFLQNQTQGPGHAFLVCAGEDFRSATYQVTLQRSGDRCYLNASGEWGAPRVEFPLKGGEVDGSLTLPLGPRLVSALSVKETYKLSLQLPNKTYSARLRISEITYPTEASLDQTILPTAPLTCEKANSTQAEQVEEEVAKDEPKADLKANSKKKALLALLGFVAALSLILGVFFWFTSEDEAKKVAENAPNPSQAQTKAAHGELPEAKGQPQKAPQASAASSAGEASGSRSLTCEEEVLQFFANPLRSQAEAAELARRLPKSTVSEQDAVFRLYYFAVYHGEPSLYLDYAKALDPSKPTFGTIQKNAPEALRFYQRAKESSPEAGDAYAKLVAWLKDQANHDPAAAKWWQEVAP